jgi:hypothetical protein
MKQPTTFENERENDLDPFVAAAKTAELATACHLLFIGGADLVWSPAHPGLYIAEVEVSEEFSDQYKEAVQLTSARADLGLRAFAKRFVPLVFDAIDRAQPPAGAPDSASERRSAMIAHVVQKISLDDMLIPSIIAELPAITDLVAKGLIDSCARLRVRLLGATGFDDEAYSDMIYALRRCEALVGPILRAGFPQAGYHAELSLCGYGLAATALPDDAHEANVYRLGRAIEALKRPDQDFALSIFVAAYVNRHAIVPEKQAFACARYGAPDTPEFDVLIPRLEYGFEVKLYGSPATLTKEKLAPRARELNTQLKNYFELAKARTVFYVTNLQKEDAQWVLREASRGLALPKDARVVAVAGLEDLMLVLNDVGLKLEQQLEARFETAAPTTESEPAAPLPAESAPVAPRKPSSSSRRPDASLNGRNGRSRRNTQTSPSPRAGDKAP